MRGWMYGSGRSTPRSQRRDLGHPILGRVRPGPPAKRGEKDGASGTWATRHACALGLGQLKVFFSQHGTRGVARVYVDLDGLSFVRIRPSLGLFLIAQRSTVI